MAELLRSIHPGEILLGEFVQPAGVELSELARGLGVSPRRIEDIVRGRRPIDAELDLRLTRYFGLPEGFFLRLQMEYDLEVAKLRLGERLQDQVTRGAAA